MCRPIFDSAISKYHVTDDVDTPMVNPYAPGKIEHDLYTKNWIDTVQWHLEDIIRDPNIDPVAALALKRRIDKSNQDRTDLVERIDSYFYTLYKDVIPAAAATINTESPAWAIDRLSILALKIYHMPKQRKNIANAAAPSSTCCSNSRKTFRRLSTHCSPTSRPGAST